MDPDSDPVDPRLLDQLEQEVPVLANIRRFAERLERVSWFSHLGEAPTPAVREAGSAYLDALGFPDADLAILRDWEDAAAAAETLDWASPAWEAEELARADLTMRALNLVSEEALEIALRLVAQHAGEAAKMPMEEQASLWDMTDEGAMALAVGSAAQTCHSAGLLLIAAAADPEVEASDHFFAWKLRLFELGRWPVTVLGSSFSLF